MSASAWTQLASTRTLGCVCAGREGGEREAEREGGSASARTHGCVHADTLASARTDRWVRADASVLPLGYFISDGTVRPSYRQPSGHRPTVRPSAIVRVTTLL
jgi:hypothetical protein